MRDPPPRAARWAAVQRGGARVGARGGGSVCASVRVHTWACVRVRGRVCVHVRVCGHFKAQRVITEDAGLEGQDLNESGAWVAEPGLPFPLRPL